MDSITDRIKKIILDNKLSPARFADEISVQRSSISHILSGRNKPSLEIVQKTLIRFPETDITWLLNGEPETKKPHNLNKSDNQSVIENITDSTTLINKITNVTNEAKEVPKSTISLMKEFPDKEIEKIIIFYSDKTFSYHIPEKK